MQGVICSQRLNRDVSELFSSNFNCSSSHLTVFQTGDSLCDAGSITLENKVFEGPFRGGRYSFCFSIPANYPFRPVEVWATHPIWHPNIDLRTGKVAVPLEWSPVLTLHSFAIAVQMLMLEPSCENPLNLEALSLYLSQPVQFEQQVQRSIQGGNFCGVSFSNVLLSYHDFSIAGNTQTIAIKRSRDSGISSHHQSDITSSIVSQEIQQKKRICRASTRYRDLHVATSTDEDDDIEEIRRDGVVQYQTDGFSVPTESPLFGFSTNSSFSVSASPLPFNNMSYSNAANISAITSNNLANVTLLSKPLVANPENQQTFSQQQSFLQPHNGMNNSTVSQKRSRQMVSDPTITMECSKLSLTDSHFHSFPG